MTLITIIISVLSTCTTSYININLKRGPVFASAIVTLTAGILLPYFLPETGMSLAIMATCGSYAAMVSLEKFPKMKDMIFVGIICGVVFILAKEVFLGVGGRLGAIAAISGFTWLGIKNIKSRFSYK